MNECKLPRVTVEDVWGCAFAASRAYRTRQSSPASWRCWNEWRWHCCRGHCGFSSFIIHFNGLNTYACDEAEANDDDHNHVIAPLHFVALLAAAVAVGLSHLGGVISHCVLTASDRERLLWGHESRRLLEENEQRTHCRKPKWLNSSRWKINLNSFLNAYTFAYASH